MSLHFTLRLMFGSMSFGCRRQAATSFRQLHVLLLLNIDSILETVFIPIKHITDDDLKVWV